MEVYRIFQYVRLHDGRLARIMEISREAADVVIEDEGCFRRQVVSPSDLRETVHLAPAEHPHLSLLTTLIENRRRYIELGRETGLYDRRIRRFSYQDER